MLVVGFSTWLGLLRGWGFLVILEEVVSCWFFDLAGFVEGMGVFGFFGKRLLVVGFSTWLVGDRIWNGVFLFQGG
jgi:hypothetical protein